MVATLRDCRAALSTLALRLSAVDGDVRRRHAADRTLSLRLTDLDSGFRGRIADGALVEVQSVDGTPTDGVRAQVRLTCSSDDLLALSDGTLLAGAAWASGRLRVEASPLDLLRLGTLL